MPRVDDLIVHYNSTDKPCSKLIILPLLTYCSEPLVVAGENVLISLEKIQNQSLRTVAGAVKSTPIDAMLMLTGDKPLRTVIQEKALILWEKIIRIPRCFSLWNEVKQDLTRNLKTQMGFLQGVLQLKISHDLNHEPELRIPPQNPVHLKSFCINLDLGQKITKSNTDTSILRALALEMLNILYPDPEWLRIFTDGSLLSDSPNGGAGVFSEIFSSYPPVGRGTAFDGEIAAIRTVLSQLQ
ncbi:uncharacterized protein CDAR_513391 [Caerostris darwini]|uniref:RNase H type-1 domain-containing protein n=1 Tax=Caerostris darwini TaxID=1538125 RepID=A0AAV4WX42_9ARAC|nr:uncharacterized protein CDAR_513391 [Caerostris darwini]